MNFYTDVKEKLEAAGFSFHFENQFSDKHWYCWTGPLGDWDVVVGETVDSEERAVLRALDDLINTGVTSAEDAAFTHCE